VWFVTEVGREAARRSDGCERVPGRFVLDGFVDARAHPAIAEGDGGPTAVDAVGARSTLLGWAQSGGVLVRDVGSPGGVTLTLRAETGLPRVVAAGRFLAPPNRYFAELLVDPVTEDEVGPVGAG
jgi:hypothetical protein